MLAHQGSVYCRSIRKNLMAEEDSKVYRLTPFIITFSDAGLTSIDMENFIEMGLRIIRFKMTKLTHNDKIMLLAKFREASKVYCSKYGVENWPIAISIDVPNACIKTGSLNEELEVQEITLEENSKINVTCNKKYWNKCSKDLLFMDDPFTFPSIKPGTEITLGWGKVIMFCIQIINTEMIKCKIVQGGLIGELESFCVRGIRHIKPALSNYDLKMIDFAKEYKLDIIIMNSVRYPITITRVRKLFKNQRMPHIISTICEQEGLDNIDDIIEISDGIILAREFLAYEIVNQYRMVAIQMQISGKCKQRGKPFFVSGNILEESLKKGIITDRDLYDITNTAMDNTGFILKELHDPSHLLIAMDILDSVCRSVESTKRDGDFWRILDELKMPVNAAEACCQACALVARQTQSKVIIVPTVSGKTARCLSHIAPEVTIFTITSNPVTARKLQLYRGILSIIYNVNKDQSFEEAMGDRVKFAVCYCITRNILNYKDTYVVLRRSTMYSAFADNLSVGASSTTEGLRSVLHILFCLLRSETVYTRKLCPLSDVAQPGFLSAANTTCTGDFSHQDELKEIVSFVSEHVANYDAMELPGQQLSAATAYSPLDHVLNLDIKLPAACQRLTGIIATVGKASNDVETMQKMMAAGMNIALLNLSFGTRDEHIDTIKNLRQAAKNYSVVVGKNFPLAIAARLPGRKIRTGHISDTYVEPVELISGETVRLTTDETYKDRCSSSIVYIDFLHFAEQLKKGDIILLDNETIQLKVEIISTTTLTCKIERGGMLGSNKDVFVPNVVLKMPTYSEKDKVYIDMAVHHQLDILIASFIDSKDSILELRNAMGEKGKKISIVANIQTLEGYYNFDEILEVANGVMITRQELGSDISPKKLVIAQKNMIARANKANVPVCLCAHLLSSMRYNKIPLRAELLDVANCILDGADALVLSAETAIGICPVDTISCMASACKEAEACVWTKNIFQDYVEKTPMPCDQATAIAMSAVLAAYRSLAAAIVVVTSSGTSAFQVAKYRPRCPIIAVTRYPALARQMHLYRGVMPLIYECTPDADWQVHLEQRINFCTKWAMQRGFVRVGDPIVVVCGWKQGSDFTNTMRIVYATADINGT